MTGMEKRITRTHLRTIRRDQLRATIGSSAVVPAILVFSILVQQSAIQNTLTIGSSLRLLLLPLIAYLRF